ncbi:GFA family protein [Ferrovibrio sp.]|uniref:GFA family protein n=1 Tax=Ferrovibrio sp. TaxID=1917215 RepID=UPI003D0B8469
MSNDETLSGGCLCGRVRYSIAGPPRMVSHCHCGLCRRVSGAAFVTWLTARRDTVSLSGNLVWYASSERGRRGFCPHCGSHVVSSSTDYDRYYDITAGSLDHPEAIRPQRHVFAHYQIGWLQLADDLPHHGEDGRSPVIGNRKKTMEDPS